MHAVGPLQVAPDWHVAVLESAAHAPASLPTEPSPGTSCETGVVPPHAKSAETHTSAAAATAKGLMLMMTRLVQDRAHGHVAGAYQGFRVGGCLPTVTTRTRAGTHGTTPERAERDRSPAPPVPRAVKCSTAAAAIAVACAGVLSASAAFGQERLHLEDLGDEQLTSTTLQKEGAPTEPLRAHLMLAAGGDLRLGAVSGNAATVATGLGFGAWESPTRFLQLYSEAYVPDASFPQGSATWRDAEGFHRLRANYGFGELDSKEPGLDVEVEGSLAHATAFSTSFLRPDVGPHPFWDGSASITLWPRLTNNDHDAFVVPLTVGARRLELDPGQGPGALAGFTSQRFASGIGLRDYAKHTASGWFEVVGVSLEQARFDAAPLLAQADKLDVYGLRFEHWVSSQDSDMAMMVDTSLGGSWVWDPATQQQTSTFAFRFGMAMKVDVDPHEHPSDHVFAGLAGGRDAGWLADGNGLTRQWRIEAPLRVSLRDDRLGGSLRVAAEDLDVQVGDPTGRDGWRATVATEWYFAPLRGFQLGAHHASTNACVAGGDSWCHTVGLFLRLTGDWAQVIPEEKKADDDGDTPPPEAPPGD